MIKKLDVARPVFATEYQNRIVVEEVNNDPTMTQQNFKEECDINNIMRKYQNNGTLPDMIKSDPRYGDFSDVPSYQRAMDIVIHAHTQFESLSADLRDRFANDPAKFLEFCHNPANVDEMVKLGLATAPKPVSEPVVTPKTEPVAPKTTT